MLVTCFSTARSGDERGARRSPGSSGPRPSARAPRARAAVSCVERVVAGACGRRAALTTAGSSAEPPSATRRTAARELLDVRDAVLEQVADALGARLRAAPSRSPARRTARGRARRPRDAARGSRVRRAQALVGVGRRHADVDDRRRRACASRRGAAGRRPLPDCATTSKPASSSSRAMPSRSSTESSASTTRARVAELRDGAAQRREVAREPVGDHLVDALGIGQALEAVGAEIARLDAGDERAPRSRRAGPGRRAPPQRCARRGSRRDRCSPPRRAAARRCGGPYAP